MARTGLSAVLCALAFGQNRAAPPSFEAAVVRPDKSGEPFPERKLLPGGQLTLENYTLRQLIAEAWQVRNDQILAAPRWCDSDRFDVVAKTAPGTPDASIRSMLQALLAERFHLAVHQDNKPLPGYALLAGKNGAKLTPTTGGRTFCGAGQGTVGRLHRHCTNMTMAALAEWLPKIDERLYIDLPVVDMTDITGAYDFNLDWTPPPGLRRNLPADQDAPTMFDAVQALGLYLERRQIPASVIVIDRLDRTPAAN